MKNTVFILFFFLSMSLAQAKLSVVTTTTDLASLVREIGAEHVEVEALAKGTQDPHFIEAKPSYMLKLNRADLLIAVGLDLEIGWLPSILRGARNPKILLNTPGYMEAGTLVQPIEKVSTRQSRAQGDVHPEGNPHFMLDPVRAAQVAAGIAERLAKLDAAHAHLFRERAAGIGQRFGEKTKAWRARIERSGIKSVVTYHKTLSYFLERFGVEGAEVLEPKPGVPPTAPHIVKVRNLIKERKIPLILIENYFESSAGHRIARDVAGLKVVTVPVAVQGEAEINDLDALYERLVRVFEVRE